MKKFIFTIIAASVGYSMFATELNQEDVDRLLMWGLSIDNARPARTEYNEADLVKKEALIKSLGLSYDGKIFDPNFSASDYSVDIEYVAEKGFTSRKGFTAEKMSMDELDRLFSAWSRMIKNGKITTAFTSEKMIVNIAEMIFKSESIDLDKLNFILNKQNDLVDQMIASNVSFDMGKVINGLTNILTSAVNLSKEQVELVFTQYERMFDKVDVDSDTYNKDALMVIKSIIQTTASINASLRGYDKQAMLNAELVRFSDPNQKWVSETIKDPYLCHAEEYANFDSKLWAAWRRVFESKPAPVKKIGYKVPKDGRFVFEVWTPKNQEEKENLMKELDFMKSRGYIGVVTMWDGKSNYKDLVSLQKEIKDKGFRIWLGFSTYEGECHPMKVNKTTGDTIRVGEISVSTFVEPVYYREGLKALAANSEAFLMGWRRTSLHHNTQNVEWQNYTMNALRDGNPEIGFIGEFYYGENGSHPYGDFYTYGQYANYRDNYDAVLLVNYGYISVNPKWAIATARRVVGQEPQLVCVIQGIGPGYISKPERVKKTRKRTIAQYRRINELLEKRFLRAGFDAVCGLAGDGLNAPIYPDDMCKSKNHNPSKEKF